jgi:hypothetical protein
MRALAERRLNRNRPTPALLGARALARVAALAFATRLARPGQALCARL